VVGEYRIHPGPVPIPYRHLKESRVLERAMKRRPVMMLLVQVVIFLLIIMSMLLIAWVRLKLCNSYTIVDVSD